MEGYRQLINETNKLSYINVITKVVPSRRKIVDALKLLNDYRSTNKLNTALFVLNYKNILNKMRCSSKMKTLRTPNSFVQRETKEVVKLLEKSVDAAIKRECSLCGPIRTSPSSQATTHGRDLPINFSSAKRWVVLPSGRTRGNKNEGRSQPRRLIVEQTGRYEGARFVPRNAGKHLHWVTNNSTLVSKNCCLLEYLNKRALKKNSVTKDYKQGKFIESISLKLGPQNVKEKEIVTRIDQEDIKVAILL